MEWTFEDVSVSLDPAGFLWLAGDFVVGLQTFEEYLESGAPPGLAVPARRLTARAPHRGDARRGAGLAVADKTPVPTE